MKNTQKGFIVPLLIIIVAVLAIGAGVYVFNSQNQGVKTNVDVSTSSSTSVSTSSKSVSKTSSSTVSVAVSASATLTLADVPTPAIENRGAKEVPFASYTFSPSSVIAGSHILLDSIQLPLYYSNGASPAFLTNCKVLLSGKVTALNSSSQVNPQGNSGALQTFVFDAPDRSFEPNKTYQLDLFCDTASNATGTFQWGLSSQAKASVTATYPGGKKDITLTSSSALNPSVTIGTLNEYPETTVTLLSPNGGEIWKIGGTYDIKWIKSAPIPQYARFGITLENIRTGDSINIYTSGKGENSINGYTYRVPSDQPLVRAGESYKVRIYVQDMETNNQNNIIADDYSNSYIQISQ